MKILACFQLFQLMKLNYMTRNADERFLRNGKKKEPKKESFQNLEKRMVTNEQGFTCTVLKGQVNKSLRFHVVKHPL